ncbi:MAG: hypothetical protein SNJ82_14220 [Gemmataceae bacterium]
MPGQRHGGLRSWLVALFSFSLPLLALSIGCHSLAFLRPRDKEANVVGTEKLEPIRLPCKYQVRIAPVLILSDFELRPELPMFQELADLRTQIQKQLLLPPSTEPVKVYIFETEQVYSRYLKSLPDFRNMPERRAYFIVQPRGASEELMVYTYWSKRIKQDLRHELTHAMLHSVIKEVPLWLDEGLAEYFELRPEMEGINADHVRRLANEWSVPGNEPDLGKLEAISEIADMTPPRYREAWAWVHLLLHSNQEAKMALLSHLQQLRGMRHPGPLLPKVQKLFDDPKDALREHVRKLAAKLPSERETGR